MKQFLGAVSLVVRDYDEAIAYYTQVLGFRLVEDSPRGPGRRWVVVGVVNHPQADAARPALAALIGWAVKDQ